MMSDQSAQLSSQVDRWLSGDQLTTADLRAGLDAVETGIARLKSDPVAITLNLAGARDALEGLERDHSRIEARLSDLLVAQIEAAKRRIDETISRSMGGESGKERGLK